MRLERRSGRARESRERATVRVAARLRRERDGLLLEARQIGLERDRLRADCEVLRERLGHAEKLAAVGRYGAGIAHDFGNLLGAVLGYAGLLREGLPPDSPLRQDAEQLLIAAQSAAELSEQLLAFGRKRREAPQPVALNDVVEEARSILARLLGEHVILRIDLDPRIGLVEGDPVQLTQVVLNLAANARDAMPGGGELLLATHLAEPDEPGRFAVLVASDTGTGMDEETAQRALEPFFTTKAAGAGTGLGLSTIKDYIESLGGRTTLESAPGFGTSVSIWLPLVEVTAAAAPSPAAAADLPAGEERVLLVEDEPGVRRLTERLLKEAGYAVVAADGPTAAIERVRGGVQFDLLLTDVVMPGLSGRELVRALRPLRPAFRVLYMSGYPYEALARQGFVHEDVALLAKPYTRCKLLSEVRRVLDEPLPGRRPERGRLA